MAAGAITAASGTLISGSAAMAAGVTATAATSLSTAGVATTGAAAGSFVGTGTGLMGTGLTATSVLGEVAAFVGMGQSIHQHQKQKAEAKSARIDAEHKAGAETAQAADQATRAQMEIAEEKAGTAVAEQQQRGVVGNLMNRSDMQIARLQAEVDRDANRAQAVTDTKAATVRSDQRIAYRNIDMNRRHAYSQIKDPSKLGLALQLGSSAIGGFI
jgi:hypothetical protein